MSETAKGRLIIIGGHEEKQGDRQILTEVARTTKVGNGRIVVITVASREPAELAKTYKKVFGELGVQHVDILDIRTRDEATNGELVEKITGASTIFFTGGDQLRITSQIGDSPVFRCIRDLFEQGGTVVGTSAGAAAMPETMLISGPSDQSLRSKDLGMAPGLALISGVVIDSHFAERGRIGRLLSAVVQNPRNIGLGIDEDTAIVVEQQQFRVIGSGAVYVADGIRISYSSLSEKDSERVVSMGDVTLHVLADGDHYDLAKRRPHFAGKEEERSKANE